MESFSKMHDSARELIKESVQTARQNYDDAYRQFKQVYPKHSGSLRACIIDDQEIVETVPLMLYLDDIRIKLQERNGKLVNLKKRYITNKVMPS